jgi:hypothetical protein
MFMNVGSSARARKSDSFRRFVTKRRSDINASKLAYMDSLYPISALYNNYIVSDRNKRNNLSYPLYPFLSCTSLEHKRIFWAANIPIFDHAALQHIIPTGRIARLLGALHRAKRQNGEKRPYTDHAECAVPGAGRTGFKHFETGIAIQGRRKKASTAHSLALQPLRPRLGIRKGRTPASSAVRIRGWI